MRSCFGSFIMAATAAFAAADMALAVVEQGAVKIASQPNPAN
jgi:hypothetical protein